MRTTIRHEFVETIPEDLDDGVLYVSITYSTAVHKCVCGCGHEVVTPLAPRQWWLTFDGEVVSLAPSIGNWSFPCRSHYWIRVGEVHRARTFTDTEIAAVRADESERLRRPSEPQSPRRGNAISAPKHCFARSLGWLQRMFK
ncbi:DUF6527 family protein [Amycolatopsis thermoflava]|uniref:DUF6527 family protein n=1 Tax=Amycolatopsis thermoflava TaxID=84480 RepID=UPI000F4BF558|nr:DUF6527 family protein [Amycolatopsis thermoflava]